MSWQAVVLQLLVAAVPAGGVYALFRLGPERRKLSGEALVSEASAASVLTGRALEMLQHAEAQAELAKREARHAERRAAEAQAQAEIAGRRARDAVEEAGRAVRQNERLGRRVEQLTDFIRAAGCEPPPWDRRSDLG